MKKIIPTYCIFFAAIVFIFASNAESQQMLHGHVPSIIAKLGLHPISRLDSTKHLHLAIGLPTRNQAMLNNLLNQIYNPASPNYHKYLTSKQSTENFGPTENDY
ncbi:MAG: protease pro-enzyme activation domain-containing protein, partial [Bacteroidota bacterium]